MQVSAHSRQHRYQSKEMRIRTRSLGIILIAALVAVASFASAAAAAGGESGSAGEPSGLRSNIGSLPFTGMDLLILGGLALMLFGTGFLLRKLSAPRRPID
jgi:hypothetical protein